MPIEFRCDQCGKLLRTADDTAGRQAKCPSCGKTLSIPQSTAGPPDSGAVPPARPGAEVGGPFGTPPVPMPPDEENPYQAPTAPAGYDVVAQVGYQPTVIDIGDVMGRTWEIYKAQLGMCILVAFLAWIVNFAFSMFTANAPPLLLAGVNNQVVVVLVFILSNVANYLFSTWINLGLATFMLKVARGQEASIGDLFAGGRCYLPILVAQFLFSLMVSIGTLFCIVPGILLALMFCQYYYLILDRDAGIIESFSMSNELTQGNKLSLFVLFLLMVALMVVGLMACIIGIFFMLPYVTLMWAVIYLVMTGQPTADQLWTERAAA